MTKEEFENDYAARSGLTVAWLHEHNQFGVPCDCGEYKCMGWQMKHIKPTIRATIIRANVIRSDLSVFTEEVCRALVKDLEQKYAGCFEYDEETASVIYEGAFPFVPKTPHQRRSHG